MEAHYLYFLGMIWKQKMWAFILASLIEKNVFMHERETLKPEHHFLGYKMRQIFPSVARHRHCRKDLCGKAAMSRLRSHV